MGQGRVGDGDNDWPHIHHLQVPNFGPQITSVGLSIRNSIKIDTLEHTHQAPRPKLKSPERLQSSVSYHIVEPYNVYT